MYLREKIIYDKDMLLNKGYVMYKHVFFCFPFRKSFKMLFIYGTLTSFVRAEMRLLQVADHA